ncbi:MAG TPA: hypothetical protein PLF31_02685 [Candidatus Paceibacterota bacterium]|nr:hypothetical protein [Candidatus Paceibacterota bacterium]
MVPHAYAEDGSLNLISCGKTLDDQCDFYDLINLGHSVINAVIFLALILLLFMLLKAGWQYLFAGASDPGVLNKAKKSFTKIAVGIFLMLIGWLVINFVVESVVDTSKFDNPLTATSTTS